MSLVWFERLNCRRWIQIQKMTWSSFETEETGAVAAANIVYKKDRQLLSGDKGVHDMGREVFIPTIGIIVVRMSPFVNKKRVFAWYRMRLSRDIWGTIIEDIDNLCCGARGERRWWIGCLYTAMMVHPYNFQENFD